MREHWSDCAVHNAPALPVGECDCGGLDLADNASHGLVPTLVPAPWSGGLLVQDGEANGLVETQELPSSPLVVGAPAPHLPDPHDGIAILSDAASVDLDVTTVAVVPNLKQPS